MITSDDFKKLFKDSRLLFFISEKDAQLVAQLRIKRTLTEKELLRVSESLEEGLNTNLSNIILAIAIDEATKV